MGIRLSIFDEYNYDSIRMPSLLTAAERQEQRQREREYIRRQVLQQEFHQLVEEEVAKWQPNQAQPSSMHWAIPPRRRVIERMGLERFVTGLGGMQNKSEFGELWQVYLPYDEPVCAVKVTDPYPPNKEYWIRVPPDTRTAKQAVAWSFGFNNPDEYHPVEQS